MGPLSSPPSDPAPPSRACSLFNTGTLSDSVGEMLTKITETLRSRLQDASGWPLEDTPLVGDSSPKSPE